MQDFRMSTFLSVCRTLNYTRSAAELNITQPAVSQHIAYLEKAYGAKLLSYRGKKLALTAGEYVLAEPLAHYLVGHPEVQVRIASSDTERLLAQLHAGEIDCALVEGFFDKSAYDWRVFATEHLMAVCAPDAPLAGVKEPQRFEDLLDQHILVRERGSGTRAVLEHALAARNLSVDSFARATEVESVNIIKQFAASGYGIAFLYGAAVVCELEAGTLARIPLAGHLIEHDITFIRPKGCLLYTSDAADD